MLPDGARPNRQNNIRELSSGDPRRIGLERLLLTMINQKPENQKPINHFFGNSSHFLS